MIKRSDCRKLPGDLSVFLSGFGPCGGLLGKLSLCVSG